MTAEPVDPLEDRYAGLLATYDAALRTGQDPASLHELSVVPGALQTRFGKAQQCLRLLEQVWPRQQVAAAAGDAAPAEAAPMPISIGRFRLTRELGRGGGGIVFLAFDSVLGREVALKVPRLRGLVTPELRQRFLREARAAARLSHPHILPVFELCEVGPCCYIVATYCAGGSLAGWLAAGNRLRPRQAATLVAALAGAVQHAHERGVLHRDLKPANVLLESLDGEESGPWQELGFVPRIADFGLAKLLEDQQEETPTAPVGKNRDSPPEEGGPSPFLAAPPDFASLTQTQAFLGTPAYMAPEQAECRRHDIGPATDVYALGALLYEVLTGQPPFRAADHHDLLRRVVEETPVPPSRLQPGLPRDLEAICLKCLEKPRARRYARAGELAEDLERFQAGLPTRARPLGVGSRLLKWSYRRPALAMLVCLVCLGLTLLAGGMAWHVQQLHEFVEALSTSAQRERERADEANAQRRLAEEREIQVRLESYGRQLPVAAGHWQEGRTERVRPLLQGLRPLPEQADLRGFEWHYLWNQGRGLRLLSGHGWPVYGVAFSPDGRYLVSTGGGRNVKRWALASDFLEQHWDLHSQRWSDAALSADSTRLFVAAGEHATRAEMQLWDATTGRLLARHPSRKDDELHLAISPTGRTVAYSCLADNSLGREIRLWDAATGRDRVLGRASHFAVTDLRFSLDERTLAVAYYKASASPGSTEFLVELWEATAGRVLHTLSGHQAFVVALAFSPDQRILATGSRDRTVRLWDTRSGGELRVLTGPGAPIGSLAFSPDGKTLAVGTAAGKDDLDRTVSLWQVATGRRLAPSLETESSVNALAFAPNGKTVAAGCSDKIVRLWEPSGIPEFTTLPGPVGGEAFSLAFSPDGRTLAVGYDDEAGKDRQTLMLWDVATRQHRATLPGHAGTVFDVAFARDGQTLVSCSWDKRIKLWDPQTGALRATLTGHTNHVRCVALAPDGRTVASGSRDGTVRFWDTATERERSKVESGSPVIWKAAYTPDGTRLAFCSGENIQVWEMPTETRVHTLTDSSSVFSLAISPDGRTLATGNTESLIKLWELPSGKLRATLQGHQRGAAGTVLCLAFSPDGRTLASGGEDKAIRLWQSATGAELLCLKDQPDKVHSVAFSPSGRILAAALHDGSVRLWEAVPAEE